MEMDALDIKWLLKVLLGKEERVQRKGDLGKKEQLDKNTPFIVVLT